MLELTRLRARLARSLRTRVFAPKSRYVDSRVAEYRGYWEAGARALGAEFIPLTAEVWEVRRNGRRTRLLNYMTACDSPAVRHLAGDKRYCYGLATACGVPVPAHVVVTLESLESARAFFGREAPPFVVKPARGTSSGLGVTTHVGHWRGLVRAAALAALYSDEILVERMVPGESCRLLFLNGRLIHAVRRRGQWVLGDGRRPIQELAHAIGIRHDDQNLLLTLGGRDNLAEVPAPGQRVLVRSLGESERDTRELRTVYDESVTHLCGAPLVEECARVVATLGSEFAGIDLICNDLGKSLEQSGGTFLEINTTPGIHHHYITPEDHTVNPVAVQVLEYLLETSCRDGAHHGKP